MRTVIAYQIVDHGEDGSQYFPGCGVAFTDYDNVATGCGSSEREAAEDAIEQSVCGGDIWPADLSAAVEAYLEACSDETIDCGADDDFNDDWHYYVSIRVKYSPETSESTPNQT